MVHEGRGQSAIIFGRPGSFAYAKSGPWRAKLSGAFHLITESNGNDAVHFPSIMRT